MRRAIAKSKKHARRSRSIAKAASGAFHGTIHRMPTVPKVPEFDESSVIEARNLTKTYGSLRAVDDVSFSVLRGEIFGLLGPNGAGKTTTMECVEGIRRPDSGEVRVLGFNPYRDITRLQHRIGVQLQQAELQKRMKVWEAVDLMASLYASTVDAGELLERLGLSGKSNARFMNLSGGQKQRLFIALALINDPEVVFLDELTTGLDPQARRAIWQLVEGIRDRGKTVLLTTHLMEEAERLCDRVAIVEKGKIIAMDTPRNLVQQHCPEVDISFHCRESISEDDLRRSLPEVDVAIENGSYRLTGVGDDFISGVIRVIAQKSLRVEDLHTHRANLEDVFLKLTGHSVRE